MQRQLDPRSKLLILVIMNLLATFAQDVWIEFAYVFLLALCMVYQRQYKIAIGSVAGYGAVYLLTVFFVYLGGPVSIVMAAFMAFMRKVFPIFMGAKLLIDSGSGRVICALQKIHLPKTLVVGLTVCLRFFPTITEEFRAIQDAMRIRGIPFTFKNCLFHPAATTEFVLVPMISRLSLVADELSCAALTRGIESTRERTSYYELKIGFADLFVLALFTTLLAVAIFG